MSDIPMRSTRLSPAFKVVLWTVLAMFLIVSGFLLHYARKLEPTVASRIKETIISSTDSLYTIDFSAISINPFTGNVRLRDIEFRANPRIYEQLKRKGQNPTHLYQISVKSLFLKRAHPIKAYFKHELDVKALLIEHPTIRMYYQNPRNENVEPEDKRTAWQRLSKYLSAIHMREIIVEEIDFQYIDQSTEKAQIDGVKNMSVRIEDLLIDSTSHRDKSRFYYSKDVAVEIRDQQFISRDSAYTIVFDELKVSSRRRDAEISGLKLIPRFQDMPIFAGALKRRIRYSFDSQKIKIGNVDFKRLIDRRELRASSLSFADLNVDVFLNKALPKPLYDRGQNFPHVALKRFALNTAIDTVKFSNSSVRYAEFNPLTEKKGRFFLNSVNGMLLNFSNDPGRLKQNHWSLSRFSGLLYGKGRLDLAINFNLTSPSAEYSYRGKVYEMNLRYFNQVLRPSALMQISSGRIDSARFFVRADARRSEGRIMLSYTGLKVGILRMNAQKMLRRNTILSLVANNLLLKEANPMPGEGLRTARIAYYRPDSVAFFSCMWNSLYSGLKETIGLTKSREQNLMMQFKGLGGAGKDDRERRRMERKEKRLQRLRKRS